MAKITDAQKGQIAMLEAKLGLEEKSKQVYLKKTYAIDTIDELNDIDADKYIKSLQKSIVKKENGQNAQTENKVEQPTEVATTETATPVAKIDKFKNILVDELNLQTATLPANFNKDRFVQNCINLMQDKHKNKINWSELKTDEVIKCLVDGARCDCEYGKDFYIIPFGNKDLNRKVATLMFDYKGLLRMMNKFSYKPVKSIITMVVYKGDEFEVSPLTNPPIKHLMKFATSKNEDITHSYVYLEYMDGGYDFEVLTRDQLNQIQKSSKSESSKFWKDWYSEMARKSAVRRLSKRISLDFNSYEVQRVWQEDLERDNAYDPNAPKEEHKVIDIQGEVA